MDVRKMYEKDFIYAYDLEGRDVTVTIERVVGGTIKGTGGKETKKPVLYFKGSKKGLALCITNTRTINAIVGSYDSEKWIGKSITLFPTTTQYGANTVDCIRIRPNAPKGKAEALRDDVDAPDEVIGSHDDDPEEATA